MEEIKIKYVFNFELKNKRIKVIEPMKGAFGSIDRIGKVLYIQGRDQNNDVLVQMEDDNSIWNIGDINQIKYKILE